MYYCKTLQTLVEIFAEVQKPSSDDNNVDKNRWVGGQKRKNHVHLVVE